LAILEQKTDLKSLKNSLYGTSDLLTPEDINDPPKAKGLALQVTKRVDDLTRHAKMLTRKQGLKFIGNQALLNQVGFIDKLKDAKKSGNPKAIGNAIKDQAKSTAINTVLATASLLAQIPVNGLGIYIPRGIVPVTYLKTGGALQDDSAKGNIFTKIAAKVKEVRGDDDQAASTLANRSSELMNGSGPKKDITFPDPVVLGAGTKEKLAKYLGLGDGAPVDYRFVQDEQITLSTEIPDGKGELKTIELPKELQDEITLNNTSEKRITRSQSIRGANVEFYQKDGDDWGNLSNPIVLHSNVPKSSDGKPINRADIVQSTPVGSESIIGTENEDLIPFEFNTFYPGNTRGKFIAFRAFLNTLSDNFTGDWAGTKYVGRAEEVYTYQGFSRDVNFSFKIAALSKEDIVPLYDKINALAGSTAPVYGENGQFMKGVLTKITIGDYLKAVPGFISTVGLSWDLNTPWEIDTENGPRVPHVLNADISFTPIHNFAPTVNSRYIA
jgi:hypothetical protein